MSLTIDRLFKEKKRYPTFSEIQHGDLFARGECIFIRVQEEYYEGPSNFNAVALESGAMYYFEHSDMVFPAEGTLKWSFKDG